MSILGGTFHAITALDLSFSSLNHPKCIPTFCEYLKRDKALRLLNINCCKLPDSESAAQLLVAIGREYTLLQFKIIAMFHKVYAFSFHVRPNI